jgi:hypothetical protein
MAADPAPNNEESVSTQELVSTDTIMDFARREVPANEMPLWELWERLKKGNGSVDRSIYASGMKVFRHLLYEALSGRQGPSEHTQSLMADMLWGGYHLGCELAIRLAPRPRGRPPKVPKDVLDSELQKRLMKPGLRKQAYDDLKKLGVGRRTLETAASRLRKKSPE